MDKNKKVFIKIGTVVIRDNNGERKVKPVFMEADCLYKFARNGSGGEAEEACAASPPK